MKYLARTKMVRKGTKCYPTEVGHYNFHYPDMTRECEFLSDAVVKEKSWVGHEGLQAVTVPGGFVESLCESNNKINVVWINPEVIEVY